MAKFVKLQTEKGAPIYVNLDLVRIIVPGSSDLRKADTWPHFDDEHKIGVLENAEIVANK
jgi:hypothetical protein